MTTISPLRGVTTTQRQIQANLVAEDSLDLRFRGLTMPMDKKPGGLFATAYTRDIIKSSIIMILMTRRGERVMLPEFGSQLWFLIHEPNDVLLRNLAQQTILDDLARWEPRVRVTAVRTLTDETEHVLQIFINYEIISISVQDAVTLVFRRQQGAGIGA